MNNAFISSKLATINCLQFAEVTSCSPEHADKHVLSQEPTCVDETMDKPEILPQIQMDNLC